MTPIHFFLIILLFHNVLGGPIAWAGCQTACNAGAVLCYSQAGLVFGTVTIAAGASGPVGWGAWFWGGASYAGAAAAACSAAQGTCMAACTPLLVAPTP